MASRRAAVAVEHAANAASDWVVFDCDGHRFGVPVDRVREIVRGRSAVRLPGCGRDVSGLVNLRGRILTVIDLGAALGLGAAADTAGHRVLVVEHGVRRVGVAVGRVLGLASPQAARRSPIGEEIERAGLAVPPAVLDALGAAGDHVVGIGEWDGAPFIALDPDAILGRFFA